ncbi:hypothetical protein SAMN05216270_107186 [Glycomyces harbinensis]|uniref:Secreted protein n=2 Tax=Glycomyces harbinensis TaxID=58114 RepID=A0A1G6XIA9_9ACTN|nr:hypothetical protein SAMN05216270_107186 [Glycomyces harbinensis]
MRIGAIAAAAITALTAGLIGAVSANAAPEGCEVECQVTGQWSGGFNANGRLCDGTVSEPQQSMTAIEQVAAMQPGWNVGNTLAASALRFLACG